MEELLFRSAVPTEVRFDRREIDVLAVPYNVPTAVVDRDGRAYEETIAPGAFADVAARAKRIKVLRDHDPQRAIGKCLSIDASRGDGLYATLGITGHNNPLGDEALALAADGVLDVSIGFSPRVESWNAGRKAVTRRSCWLHELSLVALPAYEMATVLAVRDQPALVLPQGTPLLDEVRDWLTEMRYGVPLTTDPRRSIPSVDDA
jgi:HK97 family phage prohead protease